MRYRRIDALGTPGRQFPPSPALPSSRATDADVAVGRTDTGSLRRRRASHTFAAAVPSPRGAAACGRTDDLGAKGYFQIDAHPHVATIEGCAAACRACADAMAAACAEAQRYYEAAFAHVRRVWAQRGFF